MNFNFCDRGARKVGRRRATKCGCLAFQNSSPQLAVHIYVQLSCDSVDKRIGKASENGISLSSCIIPTPREHTAAAVIGGIHIICFMVCYLLGHCLSDASLFSAVHEILETSAFPISSGGAEGVETFRTSYTHTG